MILDHSFAGRQSYELGQSSFTWAEASTHHTKCMLANSSLFGGREKLALKLRLDLGLVTGGTAKRKSIGTTGCQKKTAYGRGDVDSAMMEKGREHPMGTRRARRGSHGGQTESEMGP